MKYILRIFVFLFLLALNVSLSVGQSARIDSLWVVFNSSGVDSTKVQTLFSIGSEYGVNNPDSAFLFYIKAIKLAKKSKLDTLPYARQKANLLKNLGRSLRKTSNFDLAIKYLNYSLLLCQNLNDILGQSQCHQNIGNVLFNQGKFDLALEQYFSSLKLYESLNNEIGIADCYNNIGSTYKEMESFDLALEFHNKSKDIFEKLVGLKNTVSIELIKKGLANAYNNIGVAYWHKEDNDLAIHFYNKSLLIKDELNDKNGVAMGYNNIAIVYASSEDYPKAVKFFEKSIQVYNQLDNKYGLAMVHGNIAYLKIIQSDIEDEGVSKQKFLTDALDYAKKSFDAASEIGAISLQVESANYLSQTYDKLGRLKEALEYSKISLKLQKEIFSNEKANAIAETAARYESEKSQLLIENMAKEQEIFERRIGRQRILIAFIASVVFLLGVSATVLLRFLNQKREAYVILTEQNEEILQQKEEILAQVDELEDQRNKLEFSKGKIENLYHIALEQKEVLEKQKNSIDDSIRYAHFIQRAVLPDLDIAFVSRTWGTQSYFIMFRPKDVVSGDFYWATRINDWLIVTVGDCTGHGVPGAFMSMLGMSFLNEIVLTGDVVRPSEILSKLRSYIIVALKQKDEWGSQRDGIDMSVLSINTKTKQCIWAGANNPLWIVRGNQQERLGVDSFPVIEEIKPNTMPVAVHIIMGEFTDHEIQLKTGDRLYLFSDGYPDQFGGPNGKKFNMHKAFKNLIAQTSILPMKEQGKMLEDTFDKWISCNGTKYDQVDDVTFLGIMV